MYKSIDFGKTWAVHTVTPMLSTEVNEIAFLDDGLTGVAHLRNYSIGRTYVLSTTDGGLTWTNYFQPPNWKNSRVTAVPGTNAFVSTSTHGNPAFTGSSVSYDAGKTWTHIDQTAQKAVCRFYDANTGYAGGFHVSGHPFFRDKGIFKSQIIFQLPSENMSNGRIAKSVIQQKEILTEASVSVYPSPAKNVVNIALPEALINAASIISIVNMEGKVVETRKSISSSVIQVNTSKLTPGIYIVRIASNGKTINKTITVAR